MADAPTNGESTAATVGLRSLGDLRKTRAEGRAALLAAMGPGGDLEENKPKDAEGEATAPNGKPAPTKPEPAANPDDDAADEADEDAPADAETTRKLAALKRQEQRGREALAKERGDLERERAELAQLRAKVDGFDRLAERAKYDPVAALQALGLGEDDFEVASKDLYAHSKAAAANPQNREAVRATQQAREDRAQLTALRKEMADLRKSIADREAQAATQGALDRYFAKITRAVTPESAPLLAADLDARPKKTQRRLAKIAGQLAQQEGVELNRKGLPKASAVIQRYEARRRAQIEEMGYDASAYRKTKTTKDQPQAADKDRSAPTPSNGAKPTGAKAQRADLVSRMEADQLD